MLAYCCILINGVNLSLEYIEKKSNILFLNYDFITKNTLDTGPVTDTTDPDVCIAALSALYAHGGGDCPELALTGLENALHRM